MSEEGAVPDIQSFGLRIGERFFWDSIPISMFWPLMVVFMARACSGLPWRELTETSY